MQQNRHGMGSTNVILRLRARVAHWAGIAPWMT